MEIVYIYIRICTSVRKDLSQECNRLGFFFQEDQARFTRVVSELQHLGTNLHRNIVRFYFKLNWYLSRLTVFFYNKWFRVAFISVSDPDKP